MEEQRYFNRELSWLKFNFRVMMEAKNEQTPLFERLKFMAIYSSNLDEFFRVRMAFLHRIANLDDHKQFRKTLNVDPKIIIQEVQKVVGEQYKEFRSIFKNLLLPALKAEKIILYRKDSDVKEEHKAQITFYFRTKVLAYLQPMIVSSYDNIPFLENKSLYLALKIRLKDFPESEVLNAILNIPSDDLPRFYELKSLEGLRYYIFLDEVIRLNIGKVFSSYEILECHSIKMNRDAEISFEGFFSEDLAAKMKKELGKRKVGDPTRFLYDSKMPQEFLNELSEIFDLDDEELVSGGRYHNFSDLAKFPNPYSPKFEHEYQPPMPHLELDSHDSLLDAINEKDYLLHFPYQSYDYVLRFFNEAAIDPYVQEIKVTVYRIAANSFIANALISAARNGKRVTVLVEYKARFDEENNLRWAEKMEKAGVKIIYSIEGLKVHAKIAIVTRRDKQYQLHKYAYMGTGNFNEITARIYTDHGLLTSNKELLADLESVFMFLDKKRKKPEFKHLLVSQFNLKERFVEMIDQEIAHAQAGKKALIILKMNNLEDTEMIDKLYEASKSGVKIELFVRSICCLKPQTKGLSENIRVIRLIDRYLEHSRIFYFYNDGKEDLYLASADWMHRNLHGRIEVGFPILESAHRAEIMKYLDFHLADNTQACLLDAQQNNVPIKPKKGKPKFRAQREIYNWVKTLN